MRETVEQKGRRYLTEGRLTVVRVDDSQVLARCRGAGASYEVGWDGIVPFCSCPARRRCAHIVALELVTVGRRSGEQAEGG